MASYRPLYAVWSNKVVAVTIAPGVEVAAKVNDVRNSYGRDELLVDFLRGEGTKWVAVDSCRVVPDDWPDTSGLNPDLPEVSAKKR